MYTKILIRDPEEMRRGQPNSERGGTQSRPVASAPGMSRASRRLVADEEGRRLFSDACQRAAIREEIQKPNNGLTAALAGAFRGIVTFVFEYLSSISILLFIPCQLSFCNRCFASQAHIVVDVDVGLLLVSFLLLLPAHFRPFLVF